MSIVLALPTPPAACPQAREKVIADALRPLAAELMLVDPAELIHLCRAEKHAHIDDLVDSATELLFKPGTLRYGGAAEVELQWDGPPAVVLDMEFEHDEALVLFRLKIAASGPSVDICHAQFRSFSGPPAAGTQVLAACLDDARRKSLRAV